MVRKHKRRFPKKQDGTRTQGKFVAGKGSSAGVITISLKTSPVREFRLSIGELVLDENNYLGIVINHSRFTDSTRNVILYRNLFSGDIEEEREGVFSLVRRQV